MEKISFSSPAVHSYLSILQGVIGRMAASSAACKTWCITLVSAIIVIVADKDKLDYVWISAVPIVLFLVLDSYYLSLERQFRNVYNDFTRKVLLESATVTDVFFVAPQSGIGHTSKTLLKAFGSISIWLFYALLALMLVVLRVWILG